MSGFEKPGRSEATEGEEADGSSAEEGSVTSKHVRPPRQERSRRTLERLVDAALEIIAEEGVRGATVSAVVDRAGSSVGSFYARFEGKDHLLQYLEERVWRRARRRWEEARASREWDDLDLEGVVRSVVALLVRIHREDAGTRRALGRDAVGEALGEEARRFHDLLAREVSDLLLLRRESIQHPSPERAAAVAYGWAVGGIRELLRTAREYPSRGEVERGGGGTDRSHGARGGSGGGRGRDGEAMAPEAVADEVTRGLVAYLTGGVAAPEEPGEVEFFDVWQ